MSNTNKLNYLKVLFEKSYLQAKKSDIQGDVKLFVNCFELLVEAVKEVERFEIKSTMLNVAFNTKFKEETERLEMYEKSLIKRGYIKG